MHSEYEAAAPTSLPTARLGVIVTPVICSTVINLIQPLAFETTITISWGQEQQLVESSVGQGEGESRSGRRAVPASSMVDNEQPSRSSSLIERALARKPLRETYDHGGDRGEIFFGAVM